jgi:hypothetical protein
LHDVLNNENIMQGGANLSSSAGAVVANPVVKNQKFKGGLSRD